MFNCQSLVSAFLCVSCQFNLVLPVAIGVLSHFLIMGFILCVLLVWVSRFLCHSIFLALLVVVISGILIASFSTTSLLFCRILFVNTAAKSTYFLFFSCRADNVVFIVVLSFFVVFLYLPLLVVLPHSRVLFNNLCGF